MEKKIKLENIEIYKPRDIVVEALRYKTSGSMLDLGCGFGRHALFLAHKGFTVTAVNSSAAELDSLRKKAETLGVQINIVEQDIRDFNPLGETYDLILSTMVLHFLTTEEEAARAVRAMQSATAPGGLNVICAYTDKSQDDLRPYLVNSEKLRQWYDGWELLKFDDGLVGTDAIIDGSTKGKQIERVGMIARKRNEETPTI